MIRDFLKRTAAVLMSLLILVVAVPMGALATDSAVGWDGTIATGFDSGTGTYDDPYIIMNGAQLALLAANVNAGAVYENTYFELGADIVLNDTTDWQMWGTTDENGAVTAPVNAWTPIGIDYSHEFAGSFNGNGHTVSGIYSYTSSAYSGLFGYNTGNIDHVIVETSYIGSSNDYAKCGLVGYNSNGNVDRCVFRGAVYGYDAGGIVGYNDGGMIMECINEGAVTSNDSLGGIVGTIDDGTIAYCTNKAVIHSQTAWYIGGIVGDGIGNVQYCVNEGNITVTGRSTAEAGGIAGYYDGTVYRCVNRGMITGGDEHDSCDVGGIVGELRLETGLIDECVNEADLAANGHIGGLVARLRNEAAVKNSFNRGTVDGSISTSRTYAVGGLVGYYNADIAEQLVGCYNVGAVSYNDNCRYYGGAVGRDYNEVGVTSCCYLDSTITSSNTYGTALTDEQMQDAASFDGWNFRSIWEIGYDDTYAYPTLRYAGSKTYFYQVTCVSEGEVVSQDYTQSTVAYELPTPEWEGYEFSHWLFEDGTSFAGGEELYAWQDMVLTAVWTVSTTSDNAWDGTTDTAWSGTGTQDDPYLIETPEQLAGLAASVNGGEYYYNTYFRLTNDILLNDGGDRFSETVQGAYNWMPIGYYHSSGFAGILDGDGHTISGMYCDWPYMDYVGLFGRVNGTIKNIHIKDAFVHGCYYATGALVGRMENHAQIDHVSVTATVIGEDRNTSTSSVVGGVVGSCYQGSVSRVTMNGTVIGRETYTGGIVGQASSASLNELVNHAAVYGTNTLFMGGITASANADMTACVNNGRMETVFDQDSYNTYIGGLVGSYNGGTMNACVNTGDLYADVIDPTVRIGGLCGEATRSEKDTVIKTCYNTGDVTVVRAVEAYAYAGGLIGYLFENVELRDGYSLGNVQVNARTPYCGGIVGGANNGVTIGNTYYLDTAVTPNTTAVDGTAKTDAQLQNQTTFETWNFNAEWEMGYDAAYPYPTPRALGSKQYLYHIVLKNGTQTTLDRYMANGASLTLPTPTAANYPFAYWEAENGERYKAGDTLTVSTDVVLTAVRYIPRTSASAWDGTIDTQWEGSGTQEDPYLISTPAELAGLASGRYEWNAYFLQTTDLVLNDGGKLFTKTLVGEHEWMPIGGADGMYFGGNYDGGGHTISGLYIKSNVSSVGLFGEAHGVVSNVHIRNSYVYGFGDNYQQTVGAICGRGVVTDSSSNATVAACGDHVIIGGLLGESSNYDMKNCQNSGRVSAEGYYVEIGGIVGQAVGITNSENTGEVTAVNLGNTAYVGGIAGEADVVYECRNTGLISATGYHLDIGGIVGYAQTVQNTENTGTVKGDGRVLNVGGIGGDTSRVEMSENSGAVTAYADDQEGRSQIGGIVGTSGNMITDCRNNGDVTALGGCIYAAGIGGYAQNLTSCANNGNVYAEGNRPSFSVYAAGIAANANYNTTSCVNVGNISAKGLQVYVGGIVGSDGEQVSDSVNHGDVTATATNHVYVGGITSSYTTSVVGCYSDGDVIGSDAQYMYVGGISGCFTGVQDCYVSGALEAVRSADTQQVYISGIVGRYGWYEIKSSYAVAEIVGGENAFADGIAHGAEEGNITDCYYLSQDGITSVYGTALSDEQMQVKESFVGFDFDTAWEIGVTEGYAYPTLQTVPHIRYTDVVYMIGDTVYDTQRIVTGERPVLLDMSSYAYEEDGYVYRFDHWNCTSETNEEIVYTAVFEKVAKLRLRSVDLHMTVENGYSRDNLRVDIESLYSRLVCETTTGYRVSSDVTWDMSAYKPDEAGEYTLVGQLSLLESPYYELEEGAVVTLTVTVGDGVPRFDEADLTTQELDDGTLKITGYNGNAANIRLPQTIDGKTVTVIGEKAFADNAALVSVVVPNTVITIEASAFENCTALCEVALPEGVKTIGDRAFYQTALVGLTVPASVTSMGEMSCGFFGETASAVDGFTVYAYADSEAAAYAEQNGFVSVLTQTAHDEATDIQAVIAENVTLAVAVVTEGEHFETASDVLENIDGVSLFEISVFNAEQDSVQPENVMTVSIPVPDGFTAEDCRIYRINDDGSFKDMEAQLIDGRLVFYTSHLSYYAVLDEGEAVTLGDLTNDGTVNMMDVMNMYNAASGKIQLTEQQTAISDMNGDGLINMMDVMSLYNTISGK